MSSYCNEEARFPEEKEIQQFVSDQNGERNRQKNGVEGMNWMVNLAVRRVVDLTLTFHFLVSMVSASSPLCSSMVTLCRGWLGISPLFDCH